MAKSEPVASDTEARLDIELMPALMRIPAGHRLELEIMSEPASDFRRYGPVVHVQNPLTPTQQEAVNLTGGIYTVLFGAEGASAMNLAIASDGDLLESRHSWGPGQ